LDAMVPAFARASLAACAEGSAKPRRMLAICNNLGLLPQEFFPKDSGQDYTLSPYLETLKEHRKEFTVFERGVASGCGWRASGGQLFFDSSATSRAWRVSNTISLDQFMAERIGHLTRFPSLNLGVNVEQGARSLAWTSSGGDDPIRGKGFRCIPQTLHARAARRR
jgi:hypothetical protein